MPLLQPATLDDALRTRRDVPEAVVVAGGTELMPARMRGERPGPLLDLSRAEGLRSVRHEAGVRRLGAGVTYTRAIEDHADALPLLGLAARTVASPQIRNRATLGGTVAVADPSSDVLAALVAGGAEVELASADGARTVALDAFLTGPHRCDLRPDELVVALRVPAAAGPAAYAKVGARNAMARAVCAVAVALDLDRRRVAIAIAGAAPTPVRAPAAEERFASEAPWEAAGAALDDAWLPRVGQLVAGATSPRSDRRGSAAYKRHAAAVLARRALARAWRGRAEAPWA